MNILKKPALQPLTCEQAKGAMPASVPGCMTQPLHRELLLKSLFAHPINDNFIFTVTSFEKPPQKKTCKTWDYSAIRIVKVVAQNEPPLFLILMTNTHRACESGRLQTGIPKALGFGLHCQGTLAGCGYCPARGAQDGCEAWGPRLPRNAAAMGPTSGWLLH